MGQTTPSFHGFVELWPQMKSDMFSPPDTKSCPIVEVCQRRCSLPHTSQPPRPGTHPGRRGVCAVTAAPGSVTPPPDFLKLAGKTTQEFAARLEGVTRGRKQRGSPSLLLISTMWWLAGQCTWGIIVTFTGGELLTWRKALTHEVRSQHRSQPGLTQPGVATWPSHPPSCTSQRRESTKQQQNYFHSAAGDSGCGRWPGAVDDPAQAPLMTPRY